MKIKKNKQINNYIILLVVLFITHHIRSQEILKYSNEFLKIGVGAKALSLSNSVTATVDDATSVYWNPAGLVRIKKKYEIELMHSEYFSGIIAYDFGSIAFKVNPDLAIAASFIRLGVDDIQNTIQLINSNGNIDYDRIKKFSTVDYAGIFSIGKTTKNKKINIGGAIKIIHRVIGDFAKSFGFGIDLGIQYQPTENWFFGISGKDITTTYNAWSYSLDEKTKQVFINTNNEISENEVELTAPQLTFGFARKIELKKQITITSELDLNTTFDGQKNVLIQSQNINIDPSLGISLSYLDFAVFRMGMGNIQESKYYKNNYKMKFSLGAGIKIKQFFHFFDVNIDYAISNLAQDQKIFYSNVVSIRLGFNSKNKKIE